MNNAKVRQELGGEPRARSLVERLKVRPRAHLAAYCAVLRAQPMPESTYEALMAGIGQRAARPIPNYLHLSGTDSAERNKALTRAYHRALSRLRVLHPEEFRSLYEEERRADPQASDRSGVM